MQTEQQMPIFSRSFDLMVWLLQVPRDLPRMHRHDFTRRLLNACFDLRECLEIANLRRGAVRAQNLCKADETLAKLRLYIRLAAKMKWLTVGQYAHASGMLTEVGKLLGGYTRSSATRVARRVVQLQSEERPLCLS